MPPTYRFGSSVLHRGMDRRDSEVSLPNAPPPPRVPSPISPLS